MAEKRKNHTNKRILFIFVIAWHNGVVVSTVASDHVCYGSDPWGLIWGAG